MASNIYNLSVIQGDSVALSYSTTPPRDMGAWDCRVVVKATKAGAAIVDMTLTNISPDTLAIIGLLQTAAIDPGVYVIAAKLSHASSGQSKEIQKSLIIQERAVF